MLVSFNLPKLTWEPMLGFLRRGDKTCLNYPLIFYYCSSRRNALERLQRLVIKSSTLGLECLKQILFNYGKCKFCVEATFLLQIL